LCRNTGWRRIWGAWVRPSIGEFDTNRCTLAQLWTSSSMRGSSKRQARVHALHCPSSETSLARRCCRWTEDDSRKPHPAVGFATCASVLAVHFSSRYESYRLVSRSGPGEPDRANDGHPPSCWDGSHGRRSAHIGRQSALGLSRGPQYLRRQCGGVSLVRERQPNVDNHADRLPGC
jgi:hypothetical protein